MWLNCTVWRTSQAHILTRWQLLGAHQLDIASVAIFICTLALVIAQPKGLSIGWSATGGALVALALGVVHPSNVLTVWDIVWNATLTFVAVIIISIVLDLIGFFEWAALHMLRAAKGNTLRAFIYVIVLGALVAALFANDGAALIITPIVYQQMRVLGFTPRQAMPFVMAAGFVADTTSLPFLVSNLVNIVSGNYFHIGFGTYAETMLPVDIVSFLASIAVLYFYYKRLLTKHYDPERLFSPEMAIKDHKLFRASWFVLAALLIGYLASEPLKVPVSLPASVIAAVFLFLARRSEVLSVRKVVLKAPWKIVVFSLGMYLVVFGLRNAGLTNYLSAGIDHVKVAGLVPLTLAGGFGAAVLSAVMNNMPTVLVGCISIAGSSAHGLSHMALVYSNVVGSDLGPKFTPIGSLATLLWLHVLESKGIKIGWGQYFRTGIVLTVPVLLVTLVSLAGWIEVIH